MASLVDYVLRHTERGECNCGRCLDRGDKPDPDGHTVDLGFFKVAANPLDGGEHNYMQLGGWIGDQGLAMQYMGLGVLLGVFKLLSPSMLGITSDDPMFMQMIGAGFLSIIQFTK